MRTRAQGKVRVLTHCPVCGSNLIAPGVRVDAIRGIIQKDDKAVQTTQQRAEIMDLLLTGPMETDALTYRLGGFEATTDDRTLRTQIHHLSKAIEPLGLVIRSIKGWGYELRGVE